MVSLNACSSWILIFPGIILKINILSPPHPQGELITYGDLCPSSLGAAPSQGGYFLHKCNYM